MRKPFVVISGLPGSGKTTLGRGLASALQLPFIDKDDILNRLFELKGVGNAAWIGSTLLRTTWLTSTAPATWKLQRTASFTGSVILGTSTANPPPQKS
jgi:gluconate kinase